MFAIAVNCLANILKPQFTLTFAASLRQLAEWTTVTVFSYRVPCHNSAFLAMMSMTPWAS